MGRRPLPTKMKATNTRPTTRKSKAAKAAEERQAAVEVLAAQPIEPRTALDPPAELQAPHFAMALAKWHEVGPELERTNRLQPLHRQMFAMLCIYLAEWWSACEDLAVNGAGQQVETVAGGKMERARPASRQRAEAYAAARDLAQQFGLTPREEYALFKDQTVVARENPSLFGRTATAPANDEPAAPTSSIGGMKSMRSEPPSRQVN
jgi:P27 family predicted phage terminase small subunit